MYRFQMDPCGNLQPFREEDFKIVTNPKIFLSKYKQIDIRNIPDPGKVLFGFYLMNQTSGRPRGKTKRSPLFGSVELDKIFQTHGLII